MITCEAPYMKARQAFPCGKCLPCLIRRRKQWQFRIMLETLCHSENAFVTLTYADEFLPKDLSLDPVTLQLFMKRLRKAISPRLIRYYGVGEYGDKSERPHYHLILFGYQTCLHGRSMYTRYRTNCCSQCDTIRDAWGLGHVGLGSATVESAGYVAGYITKNMRRTDDPRLKGRWPEFARMSLRPGIGYHALWEMADTMMRYRLDEVMEDVPQAMRMGKSLKSMGRYLRRQLRTMVGREEIAVLAQLESEMLAMYESATNGAEALPPEVKKLMFREYLLDQSAGKRASMRAKSKIFNSERPL